MDMAIVIALIKALGGTGLPAVSSTDNGKYLRANPSTGALEWASTNAVVVNFTRQNGTITADKTVAEITKLLMSGSFVIGKLYGQYLYSQECSSDDEVQFFSLRATDDKFVSIYAYVGSDDGEGNDTWGETVVCDDFPLGTAQETMDTIWTGAGNKGKYLRSNPSTGALEWAEADAGYFIDLFPNSQDITFSPFSGSPSLFSGQITIPADTVTQIINTNKTIVLRFECYEVGKATLFEHTRWVDVDDNNVGVAFLCPISGSISSISYITSCYMAIDTSSRVATISGFWVEV